MWPRSVAKSELTLRRSFVIVAAGCRGGAPADPCVCSRSSSACGCGGSLESRKQTGQALEVLGSNASLIYRLCDMG